MDIYLHIIVCHSYHYMYEYKGNLTPFSCQVGEHLMKKNKALVAIDKPPSWRRGTTSNEKSSLRIDTQISEIK